MLIDDYYASLIARIEQQRDAIGGAVDAASQIITASYLSGHKTFVFGSGHSALVTQDSCARAGALAFFNPILPPGLLSTDHPYLRAGLMERVSGIASAVLATSDADAGDVLIVVSNSGRNHVPIEMAIEGRARGLAVIAVTGMETAESQGSRHPSGKHLHDFVEVTVDTCTPLGDGNIAVDGIHATLGPLSTILGSAALHAITAAVTERLVGLGITPPVLISGNVDGGEAYSLEVLEKHRDRATYLSGLPRVDPSTGEVKP